MTEALSSDNAAPDPLQEDPVSTPPREWANDSLPGDDLHDAISEVTLAPLPTEYWRIVPHRASRKEIPMLGFPSPNERLEWYTNEKDALLAAKDLAIKLRTTRIADMEKPGGPCLFVGVCGPFTNKKMACRAVSAPRAIDRSIRYEASCVVSDSKTKNPHIIVRTPIQGSHESFASRFPGGVVPWQQIADDIARKNDTTGSNFTFSPRGLVEAASENGGQPTQQSTSSENVRIRLGKTSLRTVTDKSAEDLQYKEHREAGRRILVEGRVAAARTVQCD